MNRSTRKLIRRLEKLQRQAEQLKETYLSQFPDARNAKPETTAGKAKKKETPDTPAENLRQLLVETALQTGEQNALYKAVTKKLKSWQKSGKKNFSIADINEIQKIMDETVRKTDPWEVFRQKFIQVYPHFFEKLQSAYPDLTKTEIRFCAYLRSRLDSHQIASAMNISMEAIRKNRYRIRKKMGLQPEDSLEQTIENIR
jgi:DNA-binding CsgD family transcriptional regulator